MYDVCTPWCKPWEAMSMTLAPLVTSDALNVIVSTKTFPIHKDTSFILERESENSQRKREGERERGGTFEDELLATSEDVGEGLEKGFEVSDGGVRWESERNWSAAEFDWDRYVLALAFAFSIRIGCTALLHCCALFGRRVSDEWLSTLCLCLCLREYRVREPRGCTGISLFFTSCSLKILFFKIFLAKSMI